MTQKVGRNDPCPCGSGKKFKKCCGQKTFLQKKTVSVLSNPKGPGLSSLFNQHVDTMQTTTERKIEVTKADKDFSKEKAPPEM